MVKTNNITIEQFKNLAIAILSVVVLVIMAMGADKYFKINSSEASEIVVRNWPSFQPAEPTDEIELSPISTTNPNQGGIFPDVPNPGDILTPYAFINNVSTHPNYFYGAVYYSPGITVPTLLYSGNCATVSVSGNYVFCIRVDAIQADGKPDSTTPVKIDVTKPDGSPGQVVTLDGQRIWPKLWNSLVAANNGTDYIRGAMNADVNAFDYLTGPMVVVRNGVTTVISNATILYPTLSSDGSRAAYVTKIKPKTQWGHGSLFIYNTDDKSVSKIYDASSTEEVASVSLSQFASTKAFTIAKKDPVTGWTQRVKRMIAFYIPSEVNMQSLSVTYNWNANIKINDTGTGMVWEAKRTRSQTSGYNLLAASLENLEEDEEPVAFEIFEYSNLERRRMPDINNLGLVIFSNWLKNGPTPYAIYGVRAWKNAPMFPILNPGPGPMNLGATFTTQN